MKRALIMRASKKEFDCQVVETQELIRASARGNLLRGENSLVVGDYVFIDEQNSIVEREERKNEIFRVLPRENKKKVSAANCDLMIILTSVSKPEYKRGLVDRFLIRALQWNMPAFVIFNKMDEHDPELVDLKFESDRLRDLDVTCFEITCEDEHYKPLFLEKGLPELREELRQKMALFMGQSGVGKSSTINLLTKGESELKTQEIGRAGKGSHTTTWSEIIEIGNFKLIDSPGIRSFSLEDLDPLELIEYFPDLEAISTTCRFRNCQHSQETKGCAFWSLKTQRKEAILSRLDSYLKIREEVSATPFWAKKI